MKKYVGITIGPIYDTILEASTPAALWFASSMFSDITKRICKAVLSEKNFSGVTLLSPYYAEDIEENDGVGKYHDRIIFSAETFDESSLKNILEIVKTETKNIFPMEIRSLAEGFFEKYLQLHYLVMDETDFEGSAILALSPYLDMLELMKTFPQENTVNPLRKMFLGEEENTNKFIKSSRMFKDITNSQFISSAKKETIRTIEDIASCNGKVSDKLKKSNYYAMVQADGDGMGKFLQILSGNDEKVTEFSKRCLKYDEAAAKMIGDFGGMTIYAGGDDLLFMAPVENEKGETIFSLCNAIAKEFQKIISAYDYDGQNNETLKIPTISFGISLQYKKYPLYEAHQNSGKLLYTVKGAVEGKNSMAIELYKHSGQSLGVVISNEDYSVLEELLSIGNELKDADEMVTSVLYTLENFRGLVETMNSDERIQTSRENYKTAFMNLFDNPGQKTAQNYLLGICEYFYDYFVEKNTSLSVLPGIKCEGDRKLATFLYLLRLKKFMYEKGEA